MTSPAQGQPPYSRPGGSIPLPANLAVAAQRIDNSLNHNSRRPLTLSPDARTELEILHADYLGDLGQEAVLLARRDGLSTVDRVHVTRAASRLGTDSSNRFANVANSVGGLIAGAGIAGMYQIIFSSDKSHSTLEIAVASILSVVGFVILAAGVTATMLRRRG